MGSQLPISNSQLPRVPDRVLRRVGSWELEVGNWQPTYSGGCLDEVASRSYLVSMRAVGLKVLKNKLSEYVRAATAGETILVTDRDQVVAEIGPPRSGRAESVSDALLASSVRKGWITPPRLPLGERPLRQPVGTLAELLRELDEDRSR
jgi:antitoxin (DNA-binding transcriptional repressor) of toxin-antitoxin stability system